MFSDEARIFAVPAGGGRAVPLSPESEHEDEREQAGAETTSAEGTDNEIQVDNPIWSPDGAEIAFTRTPCEYCRPDLYVMHRDGTAQRRLTSMRNTYQPTWSPSGRQLAVLLPGPRSGIYRLDLHGGAPKRIVADKAAIEAPSWSSTGGAIAYARQVAATNWEIYATGLNGSSPRRLTRTSAQETTPEWSPDGRRIAFARQLPNGNWAIYAMRADGAHAHRVTDGRDNAVEPSWSPAGDRIAFTLQPRHDRSAIAVVHVGRGAVDVLTGASLFATQPAWSPDGTTIAFAARAVVPGAG